MVAHQQPQRNMSTHHETSTAEVLAGGNGSTVTVPTVNATANGGCNPQNMLWNWDTIDTCLISEQWHIRSNGMFAGACIAILLLTISLEFFRRIAKEYDKRMVREHQEGLAAVMASATNSTTGSPTRAEAPREKRHTLTEFGVRTSSDDGSGTRERFRPGLKQQMIRGLLHTTQFTIAYFIMLTAMYYNGYILLCIFLGAYIGFVVFEWEWIEVAISGRGKTTQPTVAAKSYHEPPIGYEPQLGRQV